eukprot:6462949-Amphidinium_carterae.1
MLVPASTKLEKAEVALTIKVKKEKNPTDKEVYAKLLKEVEDLQVKMEGWCQAATCFHKKAFSLFEKSAEKKKETLVEELAELLKNAELGSKQWKDLSSKLRKEKVSC